MIKNALKEIWQRGDTVINGWLHIPNTWSAEVMARQGWDSLTVDLQHSLIGLETAIQMIQIISGTGVVPLARSTWNDPGMMGRLLDAGAYGIICPMINTRADAEQFVKACRYHPQGFRSLGPTRASLFAGDDYAQHANDEILTFAMIETQEALDNVDEIASVPGLNGLYVGPGDLRLSLLGAGGMDNHDPEFLDALARIVEAAAANDLVAGIHTNSPEYAHLMIVKGFRLVTLRTDTALLKTAAQQVVSAVRSTESSASKLDDSAY